tara:strand:+ start:854 stop:1189 length:336 start_codon:yes stop_codon:yes gene_type:complete
MEFTIRDLAQFGAIAVSLVGAFITARIQIKQLIERMQVHEDLFKTVDNRLDNAESARAVIDSRVHVLSEISSVSSLEKHNREMEGIKVTVSMLKDEVELMRKMHNGKHPNV